MENILDRLFYFMEQEGLNPNKITVQAGLSIGLIGKARKTNSGLNSDSIEKILHTYPNLSADWLITGRGYMFKSKSSEKHIDESKMLMGDPIVEYIKDDDPLSERIKELKHTIEVQQELIQMLKNKLLDQDATGASVADAG